MLIWGILRRTQDRSSKKLLTMVIIQLYDIAENHEIKTTDICQNCFDKLYKITKKSLFEISYRTENNDQVQFKSMCTRFESLEEKILNDFRDDLSHRILSAPHGEYLSTFLCCNVETSKTDIVNKNLISYLRFNTNYIVGETSNVISSPHNFIYGEFTFKSKDGTSTILSSNNNDVVFNTTPTVIQT